MIRQIVRLIFAVLFLLGAIANTYMGIFTPTVYEGFAHAAIVPLYRNLWTGLVYPNIHLFLAPVVALEVAMAWLLVRSGALAKVGLWLALAFVLFLVPFWWQGGAIANLALAAVLIWLLRHEYPRPLPAALQEPSGQQSSRAG